MKKVNRTIAGMTMKRYVGATGKKIFFTLPSAPGLDRAAVPPLGRECGRGHACLLDPVLARVHAEVRMARRLKELSIDEVNPLTFPVSIISWMKFPTGIVIGTYVPAPW